MCACDSTLRLAEKVLWKGKANIRKELHNAGFQEPR